MKISPGLIAAFVAVASLACSSAAPVVPEPPPAAAQAPCVPTGQWVVPKSGETLTSAELIAREANRRVVLLGEQHDRADHHRWQLQTLAALHARRPSLVVGFEAFPRRMQDTLDRWVEGELGEKEFLERVEWSRNWTLPADLYLPLFHFARMNRVPMLALNVDRSVVSRIAKNGWDAVPEEERAGLSNPAAPTPEYERWLQEIYEEHVAEDGEEASEGDPTNEFQAGVQGFIDGQLTWDRAFAEALEAAVRKRPETLVVGVIGSGHLENGYGVSHQLADLGVSDVAVLLPWDLGRDCADLSAGFADAVFGVDREIRTASRPRLGVSIISTSTGVQIMEVLPESVAETAGLQPGDVILSADERELKETTELIDVVAAQAPGAHLHLRVRRDGEIHELVAKFPGTS